VLLFFYVSFCLGLRVLFEVILPAYKRPRHSPGSRGLSHTHKIACYFISRPAAHLLHQLRYIAFSSAHICKQAA
jgi:hypothetical protein